jgi:hypothetical protein
MPTITPTVTMRLKKVFKPVFSVQPSISGTAEVGGTLTWAWGSMTCYPAATIDVKQVLRDGVYDPTIDPDVTYTPASGDVGAVFTLRRPVTNAKGTTAGQSAASDAVVDPVSYLATTLATSIAHGPVTYHFNIPVLVGTFPSGTPFAVSDRAFQIIQMEPDAVVVASGNFYTGSTTTGQGTLMTGQSFIANGAMENPYLPNGSVQGFDGLLGTYLSGSGQSSQVTVFSSAVCTDPAINGPISISIGAATTHVKSVRAAGMTTPGQARHFDFWSALHILPTVPLAGSVAPSPSDLDKTIYTSAALRNRAALGAGFAYPSGMPTISTVMASGSEYLFGLQPYWFAGGGERKRRAMIVPAHPTGNGYSGGVSGFGNYYADFLAAMLAEGQACPDAAIETALEFGANIIGVLRRGYDQSGGAGQLAGHKQFVQFFGHYFPTVPGLMDECLDVGGLVTRQQVWIDPAWEGHQTRWPGNHNVLNSVLTDDHVGRVRWVVGLVDGISPNPEDISGIPNADYEYTSGPPSFPEMVNILCLKAGPGGLDGGEVLLRGGALDATNPYAAPIAYYDIYRSLNINVSLTQPRVARHDAYYDARRTSSAVPKWTDSPEPFVPHTNQATYLSAIAQGFSWNLTNAGGATETVLEWQVQYSHDQKFWKNVTTQGVSGSQTGLSARKYYVRWRRRSASGWGPWSVNHPLQSTTTDVLTVTPSSGAAAGAVHVTSPGIYVPKYPDYKGILFEAASGTLPADTPYISVSYGDPGTNLTDTRSFDLFVNGVAVLAGQTDFDQKILPKTAWAGQSYFGRVSSTDGTTTVTVDTATGTMPTATGTQALYQPSGAVGALPTNWVQRWGTDGALSYRASGVADVRPVMRLTEPTVTALRFWALTEALPIGYLDDVPEGEIQTEVNYGISSGGGGQTQEVIIRATGANAAAAHGYAVKIAFGSSTRTVTLLRIVNGVRTAQSFTVPGGGTASSYSYPAPLGAPSPAALNRLRVDWRMVSGSLRIRAKLWWESTDPDFPSTEPVDWQAVYTDASPLPSGEIGVGMDASSNDRDFFWMGIGVGATELAPVA